MKSSAIPRPDWLRAPLPSGETYGRVHRAVHGLHLSTVCEEARCPNRGECWNSGTATFLILGNSCTRGCRFCAVHTSPLPSPPPPDEPARVVCAAHAMALSYVVVTSVTRDDLPDGGASVFADVISALKTMPSSPLVEVLTPDYTGEPLQRVLRETPDVFAHNVEVVERLSPRMRHSRFTFAGSLRCLEEAATLGHPITKSSIMLGIGETGDEVLAAMAQLRSVGVKLLVLGQYLQPTAANAPVERYVHPDEFADLARRGEEMGFSFVAAGPLVRTSYRAAEAFVKSRR